MGTILGLPCPSAILWFCDSVILSFRKLSDEIFRHGFSQELWGLEDWNLVHIWTVVRCTVYTGIRLRLLIRIFISWFVFLSNFQTLKFFVTLFSELWDLEDWNVFETCTMGGCIVYTRIRLLLFIHPFIFSFFFLSNFQTLKCIVTLFSRTVRPKRWKHVTHVDSGWMHHCIPESCCCSYSSLFSISFSPIFKH